MCGCIRSWLLWLVDALIFYGAVLNDKQWWQERVRCSRILLDNAIHICKHYRRANYRSLAVVLRGTSVVTTIISWPYHSPIGVFGLMVENSRPDNIHNRYYAVERCNPQIRRPQNGLGHVGNRNSLDREETVP